MNLFTNRARIQWPRRLRGPAFPFMVLVLALLFGVAAAAHAQTASGDAASPLDADLSQQIQQLALAGAATAPTPGAQPPRFEIEVGQLDPRLRLAPCQKVEPYLPNGSTPWGRTRIGLRCTKGPVAWNVFLPVTVRVYGRGLVVAAALPAGTPIEAAHLSEAEVDLAAGPGAALQRPEQALGRSLARAMAAGSPLRQTDLRARQWFAAGDTVRLMAAGPGFQIGGEGQALSPGTEGQLVRIRTESGRVVSGRAVSERTVEVSL